MENKKSFGTFICQRRKELGMTQKEFAQRLFVTDSAVSKWERGLAYPDITLDRATFELSSPTGRLRLANKEFQMLELLMCNPRNLISTERFLEKIWGYDNEAEINVVWVYISYLRKKLAALHGNIQIKARRNAGYYLEETI